MNSIDIFPTFQHVEACVQVPHLKEIIILGYYSASEMSGFVETMTRQYNISIRWVISGFMEISKPCEAVFKSNQLFFNKKKEICLG